MEVIVDKELIRRSLTEMALNEPEFVNTLLSEVTEVLANAKRARLEAIVNEDFAEYKAVFNALA